MTDRGGRGAGCVQHRPNDRLLLSRSLVFTPLAFLLLSATSLHAQHSDRSGTRSDLPILELTTNTRAHALGGAFWPGNGHALFHHPALIPSQGFEVTVGGRAGHHHEGDRRGESRERHSRRDYDRDDILYTALSTSTNWMGGSLAVGMSVFDYGLTEYVGAVGYSRDVKFGIEVGAVAKVVGQSVGGVSGRTGAVDLGLSRAIGRYTAALTVQNMGPDLELAGRHRGLPLRVVLGAGTRSRMPVGPLDIGGAVQVAREGSGDVVPGGGIEIAYWPIQRRVFIVRIGAVRVVDGDDLPLTFGAGFEGDRIRLDYGYGNRDPVTGPHRFGVSIR